MNARGYQRKAWPAQKVETRQVSKLVPYSRNARTHSKAQVDKIAKSIEEWGWTNPVLVDDENGVIAGHGRILAASQLGIEHIPVMVAKGWTDAQKKAYLIADNQLALEAGWDREILTAEFTELQKLDFELELTGFGDLEIKSMLSAGGELEDDSEMIPEPPARPISKLGDLWALDDHRILCGDSTEAASFARLLDGAKPRLMVTDPPYGVEYSPEWRKEAGVNNSDRMGKVANDDRVDWTEVWNLCPVDVAYVWHDGKHCGEVARNLESVDLEIRSQIVWSKSRFAISRGNYHWQHKPCWYAVRKGSKAYWIGDRKQSTLWEISVTNDGDDNAHGTQKPLECMARAIRNHDAPDVLDPFLGSGSTLVAAEHLDRRCFGIEIDPSYVDVAILRWQAHTGSRARLIANSGIRIFDEIARNGGRRHKAKKKKKKKKKSSTRKSR